MNPVASFRRAPDASRARGASPVLRVLRVLRASRATGRALAARARVVRRDERTLVVRGSLALALALALGALIGVAAATPGGNGVAASSQGGSPSPTLTSGTLTRAARALDAGEIARADSLFTLFVDSSGSSSVPRLPGARHHAEIVAARLAASRGDWRATDESLRAWQRAPARREGSGEVLFWLGWSAMHQARAAEADSFFVLASAYGQEPRSQDALEYRFAGLMENGPALQSYLRGLPESPLPHPLRLASLNQVPPTSALLPQARWQLVLLHEVRADTALSRRFLDTLASDIRSVHGRRAAAYRALLKERQSPDTALAAYETFLIRHQQGVTAEIARQRVRILREKLGARP